MTYTFTMKRTYETVIEVDADDYDEAIAKLSQADVYATELEQCSVIEETFEHNGKPVKSITTIL